MKAQQQPALTGHVLFQQQKQFKKQEKILHMSSLIETFSNPTIKNLQSHNKNKLQHDLLDIATNFYSLIDKLDMMRLFCIDYKRTLQSYKSQQIELEKLKNKQQSTAQSQQRKGERDDLRQFKQTSKMIDENLQKSIPIFMQQQLASQNNYAAIMNAALFPNQFKQQGQFAQNAKSDPKPLIILPAKRLQTSKRQVQETINKLKVMIVKVNTKQSSSFEYVYSTYISRLKYTLLNSSLDQKRFKMHKIKKILNYLPKKYIILKLESKKIYPFHPTRYPELIDSQYNESPMFYINLYCQQLLFMNCCPISLKSNFCELLYCPITLVKGKSQQSLKISGWYHQQISNIQPLWRSTTLLLKVYNTQTSLKHPIYYSHIQMKKFQLPAELKNDLDSSHHSFNFMEHKYLNEQELLNDLEDIVSYVYQALIFNHLHNLLANSQSKNRFTNKTHIMIADHFKIQFDLVADKKIKDNFVKKIVPEPINQKIVKNGSQNVNMLKKTEQTSYEPVYKPELTVELLLFYKKKNIFTLKRASLLQDLEIMFKSTLFKIITEDMEYRTIIPAYSGSLGQYYYEKRSIKKNSVQDFLQKFGQA